MNKRREKFLGWMTLDMLVFLLINAILLSQINGTDRLDVLEHLSFLKLLILGLAAYRLANIVSNEPVTKPLRAPFVNEVFRNGKEIEQPKEEGFLGFIGGLIYCPSCSGVWLSTALVYCYVFWPAQTLIVALFLALSGTERILARVLERLRRA
jgi:hypothetical protein